MISKRRLATLSITIALAFLLAIARAVQMQAVAYPKYADAIEYQQTINTNTTAPRGSIFDRNGNVLAVSNRAFTLRLNTNVVTNTAQIDLFTKYLAPVLQMPDHELRTLIQRIVDDKQTKANKLPNVIAYNVTPEQMDAVYKAASADRKAFDIRSGLEQIEIWKRTYPFGPAAGPTIGFTGILDAHRSGVEEAANDELTEQRGSRTQVTRVDLIDSTATKSGSDVVLTIDMNLQTYVEARLAQAIAESGSESGTVIVMESRTGRILASAAWPGYDPNRIVELAANEDTARWLKDTAVSDTYEPGSVLKVCTIAAALDAGVIDEGSTFNDTGKFVVGGRTIRNSDRVAHGRVDLAVTLGKSLNVVTAQIAQKMGPEQFYRGYQAFGFGARTGIDLGGESSGKLRTPQDESWSESDLATNSYGQGMAATVYQVINAVNALANDGMLIQPYVIQEWRDANGVVLPKKSVHIKRAVSPETARTMRSLMRKATMSATPEVAPKGYTVAGKTGTADWYKNGFRQESTIVTYVGFLPADEPRLTVLVKLDQPTSSRWAKDTTIPVFRDVATRAVRLLGVPPDLAVARE
jgi:cell division protein FtsI/penicillin-binding protein 2